MIFFLAISFLLLLIITKLFLGFCCMNALKLNGMGSSTEEQWAAPPWMSASGGQLSTEGKQSSSLAPAAKVHQAPGETSPNPCSCTTLWISVTSPWELKSRVFCLCSMQVGRWAIERMPKSIFCSGLAIGLEGKGSQKTQNKHWEKVVESFSQRCFRALDRTLVKLCSQVLTGSWTIEFWLNSGCQHQILHIKYANTLFYCLSSALFLLQNLKLPGHMFVTPWDKG